MNEQLIHKDHQATGRLHDLGPGLTEDILIKAARDAYTEHAVNCTFNDPPLTRSFLMWAKTVRGIADGLPKWKRRNPRGYAITVDPSDAIAIAVAAGDEITGREVECREPSTRSPKGPATKDAVGINQQTFGDYFPKVRAVGRFQTWILLLHEDFSAEQIRLELSLPAEIVDGYVTQWRERIFLAPIDISLAIPESHEEEAEGIDIKIERRAD